MPAIASNDFRIFQSSLWAVTRRDRLLQHASSAGLPPQQLSPSQSPAWTGYFGRRTSRRMTSAK
jgi:hypothetical protein